MPRTKRKTSKIMKVEDRFSSTISKAARKQGIDAFIKEFDFKMKLRLESIDADCNSTLLELKLIKDRIKASVTDVIGNTTLEDLPRVLAESTNFITVSDTTSHNTLLEITNSVRARKARKNKRSLSLADDEAENSKDSGGTRRSRSKSKLTKPVKSTRSLSRSKIPQGQNMLENYKTPLMRAPKNEFGYVTPKVKPNTPQVILRQPKEGEMAISMQGSPLMVNTILSRAANVNIPLDDGRTISIQPQHGLRISQLPNIDPSIRRQIEVLRDNLIKVCEIGVTNNGKGTGKRTHRQ